VFIQTELDAQFAHLTLNSSDSPKSYAGHSIDELLQLTNRTKLFWESLQDHSPSGQIASEIVEAVRTWLFAAIDSFNAIQILPSEIAARLERSKKMFLAMQYADFVFWTAGVLSSATSKI
jgi:hypothetical protein